MLSDIICICPVFDRLEMAKISILSLCDLGFDVIGMSDGDVEFNFSHDKFNYIKKEKSGIVENAFNRIEYGIKTNKEFIYLFDSDSIHLPSCVESFNFLMNHTKDDEIISLYQGTLYNPVSTDILYRFRNLGGISLFFNQNTAAKCLKLKKEWNYCSKNNRTDWDIFITNYFNCYSTKKSYVDHLGKKSGTNFKTRQEYNLIEEAKNIDLDELNETILKYNNV